MAALLEVRALTRRFGGLTAVDALDFEVAEGELVSLIGPNGAGKTTTFNLVSGLDRSASGEVLFDGRRIERLAAEKIAALGIARTFQHGRVFANLSVLDNVLIGAHTRLKAARPKLGPIAELLVALIGSAAVRKEHAELVAGAKAILARFGDRLTPRLDHPASSLSYANRRRLEIARALALRPRLLMLDEPTAGMNPTETAEMEAIIGELKASGLTILLIEHKLDMVMRLSDRVYVLDDGKRIAAGRPGEVRDDPAVIEAYLGHSRIGETRAEAAE
jgi:branched-chain amino acid transport system ATP-binding protein